MLDLSVLPPLGAQRSTVDPLALVHGVLNSDSWFLLEFDGDDTVVALIDDANTPLRFAKLGLHTLLESKLALGVGDVALSFTWDLSFKPRHLSELLPLCQQRVRHFPRPADGIIKPSPKKASQTFARLSAENRWLER